MMGRENHAETGGSCPYYLRVRRTGILKSRELMLHEKNLEEFLQVILCLKGEIRCGNSSLSDALRDTACRCRGRYEEFLERVAACIEANTEEKLSIIFQNCTENYLTDLKLDEDERRKISLLGEKLGYLDREMQIRQLELYETDFLYLLQNLRKDKEEKKKYIEVLVLWVASCLQYYSGNSGERRENGSYDHI